jgi:hypothetical protein
MSENDKKWKQPNQPPPPLFLGKKERDLVKQVNDELIERVVGQQIVYYPIDLMEISAKCVRAREGLFDAT